MTKDEKIKCLTKLLTWYEDAYAHCEGEGSWEPIILNEMGIHVGMCYTWDFLGYKTEIAEFMKPPPGAIKGSFWFRLPSTNLIHSQSAIMLRINYMREQLKKLL